MRTEIIHLKRCAAAFNGRLVADQEFMPSFGASLQLNTTLPLTPILSKYEEICTFDQLTFGCCFVLLAIS